MKKKLLMMSLVLMSAFSANAANMVGPCVQKFQKGKDISGWTTELYATENGFDVHKFASYSSTGSNYKDYELSRCNMERDSLINQGYQPYRELLEVNAD